MKLASGKALSIWARILHKLSWCPSKKDASDFKPSIILLHNFNLSFPFTFRLILFTILGAIGIEKLLRVIIYWVYYYPQIGPNIFTTMNLLSDIFQTLMGIGFIFFAIDLLTSTSLLKRHSKELAFILLNFGVMKTIGGLYNEYFNLFFLTQIGNISLEPLLRIIARLASHVDGIIALYLSYRILRGEPLISRTTYKSLIVAGASLIVWYVVQSSANILAGSLSNRALDLSFVITVLSIISFSYIVRGLMNLYCDNWSMERFLSEGVPDFFRRGFVVWSVRSFLPLLVYLINPTWFLRGVYVTTGVFLGLVLEAILGLMLIVAVTRSMKIVSEWST